MPQITYIVNSWIDYTKHDDGSFSIKTYDDNGNEVTLYIREKHKRFIKNLVEQINGRLNNER